DLAEALQMTTVLIPRYPGAFSALGLALADVVREHARTMILPADEDSTPKILEALATMRHQATRELMADGVGGEAHILEGFVEMRYVGQTYALRVPFGRRMAASVSSFHKAHRRRYGHADRAQPVE